MESDPNPFPKFDILPHPIRRLGRALLGLVQMHQLSDQSDHFSHPLDTPPEPVTDWPGQPTHEEFCRIGLPAQQEFNYDG